MIRYESFNEIMPDVECLLEGHSTVGSWTLGQICDHLATVLKAAVRAPASTRTAREPRFNEAQKREIFASGQAPEGMPMPARLKSPDTIDAAEGVHRLREALAYYQSSPGPAVHHPLFGPLSKDEWDQNMRLHCAHHLSFAIPKPV